MLLFVRGGGRNNLTGYCSDVVQFTLFLQILLHRAGTHTGVDSHSSISFCHFSGRLALSQAVYCISVFVSKSGRSSSLPQEQLKWFLCTRQEQLSSSPCCQPCSGRALSCSPSGLGCPAQPGPRAGPRVPRLFRAGSPGALLPGPGQLLSS